MGPLRLFTRFLSPQLCRRQLPGMRQLHVHAELFLYTDIAKSVNKFINAAFYGMWSKANGTVSTTPPAVLYVDSDAS
jgi:hypothetical protein